jgi:hypothetical protein
MIRKFTLLFLLCIGFHNFVNAQVVDNVSIYLPYGTDTTCPGEQLTFTAVQSVDTFSSTTYQWFADNIFTGVVIDTFYTTALIDGDSVYCIISYVNSLGVTSTSKSNTIIIHRNSSFPPHVLVSLTSGSNPGCPGNLLTFTAYPANGGTAPVYQWRVNGTPVAGASDNTYTNTFGGTDTVSCMLVSNSPCASMDTAYSNGIPIIQTFMTATVSISVLDNPICSGARDTFTAVIASAGLGSSLNWFVNSVFVAGAVGNVYATDTLHDDDHVYAVLTAPDACVVNDTTVSNVIIMTVIPNQNPMVTLALTHGANPGCKDSVITYAATYTGLGTAPTSTWYINDVPYAFNIDVFAHAYANGDLLTYRLRPTDGGCYSLDSVTSAAVLMVRDTTPVAPLISLIGNLLVANTAGTYIWYFNGVIIPGANAQTYHPTFMGDYTAIRDTGNCQSLPSNDIYISLLDVNELGAQGSISVFPNPSSGIVTIELGTHAGDVKMDVYNLLGQGLLHQDISGQSHYTADLSYLPEGAYFVVVREMDGTSKTFKIQLQK